jgi:hypothetical protein
MLLQYVIFILVNTVTLDTQLLPVLPNRRLVFSIIAVSTGIAGIYAAFLQHPPTSIFQYKGLDEAQREICAPIITQINNTYISTNTDISTLNTAQVFTVNLPVLLFCQNHWHYKYFTSCHCQHFCCFIGTTCIDTCSFYFAQIICTINTSQSICDNRTKIIQSLRLCKKNKRFKLQLS